MKARFLLLVGCILLTACARPAVKSQGHCDAALPDGRRIEVSAGESNPVAYRMDNVLWEARVNCDAEYLSWQLVDGLPVYPRGARTIALQTPDQKTRFLIYTDDPNLTVSPYTTNGSQIKIEIEGWGYYVARLTGEVAHQGVAISYFWLGETPSGLVNLHCFDCTKGQGHRSMPSMAASWFEPDPYLLKIKCSGHGFILVAELDLPSSWYKHNVPTLPAPPQRINPPST